jgi:hypothetical protein
MLVVAHLSSPLARTWAVLGARHLFVALSRTRGFWVVVAGQILWQVRTSGRGVSLSCSALSAATRGSVVIRKWVALETMD